MTDLLTSIQAALELPASTPDFTESGALPSAFAVTELASASLAAVGEAVAELLRQQTGQNPGVSVDRRLASFWFASSLRPIGWNLPEPWDPIAGDYATADGWIRLHTNAPHHRAAAERVLGPAGDRAVMAELVARWNKGELEQAIVDSGGCAAEMRTWDDWKNHPQGLAVNAEALIQRSTDDDPHPRAWSGSTTQPLAGVRVLDLTRILAGPVASRMLAGLGAEVLRIDPPHWEEPSLVPEVTRGKRCARLDLHDSADRRVFDRLLGEADILLHGYRADALERLGYAAQHRRQLSPGLIDVSLNAYGWSGPWRNRRGFDSLVQMSCGIAQAGMHWKPAQVPTPLPVQALDHGTGYLMAATAIRALTERLHSGRGGSARLSLARTAKLLLEQGTAHDPQPLRRETSRDRSTWVEYTAWGPAHRLIPPLNIEGTPLHWRLPATKLGKHPPQW
ncbi:CoA transferase [Pseudomonas sp. RHF3.3-3]|uniref:Putative acyl-CoA transferase/carnitine dehydratase n=2 Tax=Pseudomonas asplenii TaxID=53407 RepID=A0A0N0VKI0_9PSED|nr:CoA transferase [Pseudomonas fuscovaginae]KPA92748.1 putative acyl-CoA transferase/carnitine dehydratase [Pseudomonas fuscovaginae]